MLLRFFATLARYGRWCLVIGLIAGFAAPTLAQAMTPLIPVFVAVLLGLSAFRIGAHEALGSLTRDPSAIWQVLVLQCALPVGVYLLVLGTGQGITPFLLATILMLTAPSVSAAPSFAIMNGHDAAPALRLLVLGTAVFPILALFVFWALPQLGGVEGVWAAARLSAVILLSTAVGFAVRRATRDRVRPDHIRAVDGASALALGLIVVGLMSAIGPMLRSDPAQLLGWISAVFCLNFGLQILAFYIYRGPGRVSISMVAGNRNVALFLIALPADVVQPLLIFIGCYQIPMYLTPILLRRLHDRA